MWSIELLIEERVNLTHNKLEKKRFFQENYQLWTAWSDLRFNKV